jgi:hypothetical protein
MSADTTRVNEWIWGVLHGDLQISTAVGGRVFVDYAPQGTVSPMVIAAYLGGADKVRTRTSRLTNALYLIRASGEGSSYDPIEAIADRMDEILTVPDNGTTVRDIRIASCIREQPHQRKDEEFGKPVVYLGGFYRIQYQPAGF